MKGAWIKASDQLPPKMKNPGEWDVTSGTSETVLTYSKSWGMRFGRYYHEVEYWTVNGVTSSNGIDVEYWMLIEPPKKL